MNGNRDLHWTIVSRGFWVNGASNIGEYLHDIAQFTLDGRMQDIHCPTLLTMAELDPLGQGAPAILEALTSPKELIRFTAAEGAGEHCEIMSRSLLNQRVFDWLDDTLGKAAKA